MIDKYVSYDGEEHDLLPGRVIYMGNLIIIVISRTGSYTCLLERKTRIDTQELSVREICEYVYTMQKSVNVP